MYGADALQKLMQGPQKAGDYIQGSIHNLLHANENAVQARNYHNVIEYNREFAALLEDNVAWLARIQEEIGECNKKLDQLLKPSEPWYNFRTRWHGPALQGK